MPTTHITYLPKKNILLLAVILHLFQFTLAQSHENAKQSEDTFSDAYYDSLLNAYLEYDSLLLAEMEDDTLSFLDLIDNLAAADYSANNLSLRFGYVSSILHAGRDYGFRQYGFSSGASYYHKSGLFADLIGYWNNDIDPNYYLTAVTGGFMGSLTKNWSYMVSYDRFVYNKDKESTVLTYPFNNAFNAASYFDIHFLSAGLDYSFLFGDEKAHRLRPNLLAVFRTKKKMGVIDRLTFMPGISALIGNSVILNTSTNYQLLRQIIRKIGWQRFLQIYQRRKDQIDALIFQSREENVFGIMNYSLVIPVYAYIGKTTILASYSLNFPVALPGENIDLTPNSYYGITLIYNFYFK